MTPDKFPTELQPLFAQAYEAIREQLKMVPIQHFQPRMVSIRRGYPLPIVAGIGRPMLKPDDALDAFIQDYTKRVKADLHVLAGAAEFDGTERDGEVVLLLLFAGSGRGIAYAYLMVFADDSAQISEDPPEMEFWINETQRN